MAEGGSPHEVPDNPRPVLDSHLLDCPICLEQLHQPKSLPCLHSFCQECLSTFISKDLSGKMALATAFPCPVCRKMTQPVNPSEDKKKWAQQFPTNNLVKDLITVTTQEPMYCKPCGKKGNTETPATIWCKTCNVLFCPTCKIEHHDLILEGCETVDVTGKDRIMQRQVTKQIICEPMYCKPCGKNGNTGTPATIWCRTCNVLFCDSCKIKMHDMIMDGCHTVDTTEKDGIMQQVTKQIKCRNHAKEMDYYCEDHQILGCSRCIIIDHRRCDVVTTTQEYCDKLKRDSRLDDLKTSLQKTTEAITLLIKEFGEQLQILVEDQDAGLKSLADLRQRVDTRLDALQKNVTDELISSYKEEKEDLETSMQKCERLVSSIQNTIGTSGTAVQRNDCMDTILLYQRGQAEMESYQDLVTEMRKSFSSVRIKHIFDSRFLTLDKDVPLTLGTVAVQKQPKQLPDHMKCHLSECRVREVGKFSIKCPSDDSDCRSYGVVYLPDDHIVVGDYNNNKIKLFTASGKFEDEMKVPGRPYDMCRVDDHTVAVANPDAYVISVVKVNSSKLALSSEIKLSKSTTARGVTSTGDGFTASYGQAVCNIRQDGNTEHLQTVPATCIHLVYDPRTQHIYGTQYTSKNGAVAVYRLTDGTRTDIATVGVLDKALGVDVDDDSNVYVCGQKSNNVVQMSGDGTHVRELLTSSDGVDKPRAISVCGNKFVVTNESSRDSNDVHVFTLY